MLAFFIIYEDNDITDVESLNSLFSKRKLDEVPALHPVQYPSCIFINFGDTVINGRSSLHILCSDKM